MIFGVHVQKWQIMIVYVIILLKISDAAYFSCGAHHKGKHMNNKSKLPVSLPEICAPREELLRHLDHAAKKQVVYMQAAGGHGKTVSTLLWLKKSNIHAAWHCFDEYDNTPALFYLIFCRYLLLMLPQNENITKIVDDPAFRDAPVEFTIEILTKAEYGEEQVALILDDFHTITNESVLKSLPYVLKRLRENVLVFILSRGELPGAFSVLENINKVSMVEAHKLAFSVEEIIKHMASYGHFITEHEAEAIHSYSEGWVILINAMVASGNIQIDMQKPRLSYKSFFEKSIWKNLDDERRDFLMKSAVPDEFTIDLCKILTGKNNSKEYIDLLIRGNANISIHEDGYRYHDLFRSFLLEQLEKSQIDKSELYKKTAQYYLDTNDYFTARRYSAKSADMAVIAESFKRIAEDKSLSLDEYVEVSQIFHSELSDEIYERLPFLYASKVVLYNFSGNSAKFEYFMDKLKSVIPVIAKNFPQIIEAAMSCFMMDYRVKYAEIAAMAKMAPPLPQTSGTQQIGTAAFHMPFIHRSSRDFYELYDPEVYNIVVTEINQKLLKENSECLSLCIHAGLCIEQNKLDEAQSDYIKAQNALNAHVSYEVGYAIPVGLAELALLKGDNAAYERHLNEAKSYVEVNGAHYLKRNLWAYEARLGLLDGNKKIAEQWLSNYFVNNSGFGALYKVYQNFTTARAFIVTGEYNSALNILNEIKGMAAGFNRLLDTAEVNILTSIISWSLGKKKEAADLLFNQIVILQPYGFIRIVANEGKAVLPILSAIIRKYEKDAGKDGEVYKFLKEMHVLAYEQSKRFNGIIVSLTPKTVSLSKQQSLILELLSKGHTNAQIVELANISINTVRYHTKIVYEKLEVSNAMDAIAKARQLGLIK